MCESGLITPEHVSFPQSITPAPPTLTAVHSQPHSTTINTTTKQQQAADERQTVIDALEQSGWVKAKAARLLNMTPRQIAYRIQIMDIDVKKI
jgi:Nif-specific regulatory protein